MQLAELNIGKLIAPVSDPAVAEFIENIDRINSLAKRMPGFVWMMESEGSPGNTSNSIGNDPLLIPNLTVWKNGDALRKFVYYTVHDIFLKRRREWFVTADRPTFVMWWIEDGAFPKIDQALGRLEALRINGDTPDAFGWDYLSMHPDPTANSALSPTDLT